jgi:hypothetical protein
MFIILGFSNAIGFRRCWPSHSTDSRGTHDTTTFENIETKKRCADFPHFNALLTFSEGDPKTAHVYHTPFSALNGITVVLATVGGYAAANIDAVANAFMHSPRREAVFSMFYDGM